VVAQGERSLTSIQVRGIATNAVSTALKRKSDEQTSITLSARNTATASETAGDNDDGAAAAAKACTTVCARTA